ncbi:DDB1- and CUL4-associated factor 17 isoform X1 [Chiloscyllium punctatum]|uniref:DDB1- and CUL4-associated factor 17 isoform X1 n=1 Tax=Chiloscyllium punctatum TaxID=137246 RepID=UPI003B63F63A
MDNSVIKRSIKVHVTKKSNSISSLRRKNNCCILSARALGLYGNEDGSVLRKNLTILRQLVCQKSTTFECVWTKQSNSPVVYEKGRIYFDNYRSCFCSIGPKPTLLYELPKLHKSQKIEDALLCESPLGEMLPKPSDHVPSLLALTANNWLIRMSIKTAEILEKIYLSSQWKFRYLTWDDTQETIVAKTTQNKVTAVARAAGIQHSVLLHLALFRVLPLTFVGMLAIDKNIFGNNVTDATVSHGLLIVMYSMGLVKLYSLQWIIEKFTQKQCILGQHCEWNNTTGIVGASPFGIPCNIKITDCPPVLFEVSCLKSALQIGGHPWHYIITPNERKQEGIYHIYSLKDKKLAENGIQEMQCCSLDTDWIYFHPDDSGRIMHIGPTQINVLQLSEKSEGLQRWQVFRAFTIYSAREREVESSVRVTAYGRVVKRRFSQLDDDKYETFKTVEYEDELELLTVLAVPPTDTEEKIHLDFYDNQSGNLIKSVPLREPWNVTYSHQLFFDRDTIIHVELLPPRTFCCHVYKMDQHMGEDGD